MHKLVKLQQISGGAPEQWEGELEDGSYVFARERHDEVRVEVDGEVVYRNFHESAHDALARLFVCPAGEKTT